MLQSNEDQTLVPDDLIDAGQAMFGSQWQSELARAMMVSDRTIRRWASGESRMPEALRAELITLLQLQIQGQQIIIERLELD